MQVKLAFLLVSLDSTLNSQASSIKETWSPLTRPKNKHLSHCDCQKSVELGLECGVLIYVSKSPLQRMLCLELTSHTHYCTISLPTLPYVLALRASDFPCTWCGELTTCHCIEHAELRECKHCSTFSVRKVVQCLTSCLAAGCSYWRTMAVAHTGGYEGKEELLLPGHRCFPGSLGNSFFLRVRMGESPCDSTSLKASAIQQNWTFPTRPSRPALVAKCNLWTHLSTCDFS